MGTGNVGDDILLGREDELNSIKSIWEEVKQGNPKLAVIMGHPGLGKTRLVQEFYHYISTSDDGVGEGGYWPDKLSRLDESLKISPSPSECIDDNPMNFLWWGLKLADSGSNSATVSSLHYAFDYYLEPH